MEELKKKTKVRRIRRSKRRGEEQEEKEHMKEEVKEGDGSEGIGEWKRKEGKEKAKEE